MSMRIPSVVSDIGENKYIIDDGSDRFFASNEEKCAEKMTRVILDDSLTPKIGERGVLETRRKHCVETLAKIYVSRTQSVLE